jgi:hypothetical protein
LEAIRGEIRGGKLTVRKFNGRRVHSGGAFQAAGSAGDSGRRRMWAELARLLRKQSCERSHTMIAATAFAVVGLVVIAFLNRIP